MPHDLDKIMQQIENLRIELAALAKNKGFTDPEIVSASQMLDLVLNEYDHIIKRRRTDAS